MKISWIESERLAASGIPVDAKDIRALHQHGIRALLSLTEQPLWSQREITPRLFEQYDISYHHVPVPDHHPPSREQAVQIIDLIKTSLSQGRPLLVHCHAGVGRTGTILHLYYLTQGYTYEAAYAEVKRKRVQCILLSEAQKQFLLSYTFDRE